MPSPSTRAQLRAASPVSAIDEWVASRVQATIESAAVRLELWNGSSPYRASRRPIGDLVVHDRGTLLGLALNSEMTFGEAYTAGRLRVRGALQPIVEALTRLTPPTSTWRERLAATLALPTTRAAARGNVHRHYDLGNEFYALWLDPKLVYTCAYFETPDLTLEAAQRAKLDLVCRKLRLRSGEHVVEAGCGWGALALHMARQYGVHVQAFNLSAEQLAYARERSIREGLTGRVQFIEDDYRNVRGQFDAFVSVGMLEHVGIHQFDALAEVLRRSVRRQGGRGLLHFIGRDQPRPLNAWIRRRIFPGAYPPTLAEVADRVLAPAGLSVIDVENLRLHYARTLAHWSARFAAAASAVRAAYGEEFQRAWELYLAGSEAAFATGWMQLFQVMFAPRESAPPFWIRGRLDAELPVTAHLEATA